MKRTTTFYWVLAVLIVMSATLLAVAQSGDYVQPTTTGSRIYADDHAGSALAEAARTGGSVVITEGVDDYDYYYDDEADEDRIEASERAYTVKKGDTLWDICDRRFADPYVWPSIWSYNTKITNPNWIYPGDVLWLQPPPEPKFADLGPVDPGDPIPAPAPGISGGGLVSRIPTGLLVRNRGFVDKETLDKAGEISGAHKEVEMIAQYDEAYVAFDEDARVHAGDEFAAYEVLDEVEAVDGAGDLGYMVEVLGQVRVTSYDEEDRIARVVVDESLRPMTRGTLVGPVHRRFDLVPTVTNDRNLEGYLIAILGPNEMAANEQIVFIDKGKKDGVREGNRFFAVQARDNWRASRDEDDDHDGYPKEVLAEIRVIETRPETSTCIVTSAIREIAVGQAVEMRKGY
jgi:hypothetical protein